MPRHKSEDSERVAGTVPAGDPAFWPQEDFPRGYLTGDLVRYDAATGLWERESEEDFKEALDLGSGTHVQGTDQGLDTGGPNAVTVAQVKGAVTNSHALHADDQSLAGLLDETAHDALDHAGLPGIPSIAGLLNETSHDALDHAGLTGIHDRSHALTSTSDHTSTATAGKMLKADASGLPVDASDTDTDVHDAVGKKHSAGTDTALGAVGTKNPPIDADKTLYRDSTASDALVTSTWTEVKAFLKTYFDGLYNKYVHPNHSGDVTSVADGATTIANKQTLAGTAPVTISNTPTVIAGSAPAVSLVNNAGTPGTITAIDIGTLANSDLVIPTSKAVKTAITTGLGLTDTYLPYFSSGVGLANSMFTQLTNGMKIYNITTDTSLTLLTVQAKAVVTANASNYMRGMFFQVDKKVAAGVYDEGYIHSISVFAYRNYGTTEDSGRLSKLYGMHFQYGHYNADPTAAPITDTVSGLNLQLYRTTGVITDGYGIRIMEMAGSGTITNFKGIHINSVTAATENRGLVIDDVTGASSVNRAVETGLGDVYFGDDVETAGRLIGYVKVNNLQDGEIPFHASDSVGLIGGPLKSDVEEAVSQKHDISEHWPIGATYVSVFDVNPSTTLGFGTWQKVMELAVP